MTIRTMPKSSWAYSPKMASKKGKAINWDRVTRWMNRLHKGWKGKEYKKNIYLQQEQRRFKSTGKYSQ